jgi:hypothetical protein
MVIKIIINIIVITTTSSSSSSSSSSSGGGGDGDGCVSSNYGKVKQRQNYPSAQIFEHFIMKTYAGVEIQLLD